MSTRTLILIIILLGVTALLLYIALAPKKDKVTKELPASARYMKPTLAISSSPTAATSAAGAESFSTNVEISTGGNKVTAVQLELSFDPDKLTDLKVEPGPFFTNSIELRNEVDNQKGTVSYALGSQSGVSGQGVVATLTFREIGKVGDLTKIEFLPKTQVTSEETDQSVLKSATPAAFKIETSATPPAPQAETGSPAANF